MWFYSWAALVFWFEFYAVQLADAMMKCQMNNAVIVVSISTTILCYTDTSSGFFSRCNLLLLLSSSYVSHAARTNIQWEFEWGRMDGGVLDIDLLINKRWVGNFIDRLHIDYSWNDSSFRVEHAVGINPNWFLHDSDQIDGFLCLLAVFWLFSSFFVHLYSLPPLLFFNSTLVLLFGLEYEFFLQ